MERLKLARRGISKVMSTSLLSWTLLTGGAILGMTSTLPAMAQEPVLRTITVTGQGSEAIATSIAQVDLGVEVQARTAAEAQREVARRATAVVNLLQARGVQKLQTTGIRLNPQYNYDRGQAELVGYIGTNTVSFRMPNDQVGTLLDDAVTAGATQIQNVSFVAEEDAIAAARQIALQEATRDAQEQASAVLLSLNLGPQEVVSIQVNGAAPPIPMPLAARGQLANAEADFKTPVVGGEQTVEASVTLQIRY
ncbi:SIMPL domain-containing protein [Pseudanabaena sp. FACHB-2040]|nr:SIMPL domain-containing protein [Pseudanabaena sp. FACHB-2040]